MPKQKKDNTRRKLVLLDTHAILHRGYHAMPNFSSSKGVPTGALYGLSSMIIKIISDLKPDYIVACYDLPQATFRHEAYAEYKAHRVKAEDDLVDQIKNSREVLEGFSIPFYECPGFEADDLLGTICEKTKKENLDVIVASGDMDTLQLVEEGRVCVYTLKKGINDTILYDEKAVIDRFGFPPLLLPDYKGLRGDPSDNIPGIKGIGEKTGQDLISKFGSLEDLYKLLEKDEGKFIEAKIKQRIIDLLKNGKEEALFSKVLATIRRDAPIDFSLPEKSWKESLSLDKLGEVFAKYEFRSMLSRVRALLQTPEMFEVEEKKENADVDLDLLKETQVALWVLNSNITNPTIEDIFSFTKTDDLNKAKEIIISSLKRDNLYLVYEEIEKPVIDIVERMKEVGIRLDVEYLKNLSKEYHKELDAISKRIFSLAQGEFNINSPKQLGEVVFDKLALSTKGLKKTEGGARSTRESELIKLKGVHPIIDEIFSYRELQKLLSTYIDNMPLMVHEDKRLHAEFLQTGTTTGRMSSQNPNLQNIPIKTESGRKIRHAFLSSPGFSLCAFDYSQIELRIAAFLSHDEKLIEIFKKGEDIHTEVAAQVFNVPEEQVDKEMRRRAKVINFGILYGMGVNALKDNLGTTRAEAQKFYNDYFEVFTGLARYLEEVKADAERRGYTTTFFGRRRYFEGIRSPIPYIKAQAERMAVNAPIQGTNADIVKIAMKKIDDYIEANKLRDKVRLLLQIHDELIFEIEDSVLLDVGKEIRRIMEEEVLPSDKISGIKLLSSLSKGKNWGELY
jgi:DNA polymerase-1